MDRIGPKFYDDKLQDTFDRMGYARMPLLNQDEVDALRTIYKDFKNEHDAINLPFITTSHSNNAELVNKVNELILGVVREKIMEKIVNSEILFSNFLVKKPGDNSESNPHQDMNIVDENRYLSFSVWIALDDNNPLNGAMRILAKSHLFDYSVRTNSNPYWRYNNVVDEIKRDMMTCSTSAGEALVFAHKTIHGSFPNLSTKDRLACVVSLYPKDAELINYYITEDEPPKLQLYAMSRDAFIKYIKGEEPHHGRLIKEDDFVNEQVDSAQYQRLEVAVNRWKH